MLLLLIEPRMIKHDLMIIFLQFEKERGKKEKTQIQAYIEVYDMK